MKVLLLQDNKKLCKKGDIVNVSEGFAFNNLVPQGIAKVVTKATMAEVERMQAKQEKELEEQKKVTQANAKKLDKKKITIEEKAKGNKLFGSVTAKDIVTTIKEQLDIDVDESMIELVKPIKELTTQEVVVNYGDDIKAGVVVTVSAK
jgi:large subunit ribosomal protein L9